MKREYNNRQKTIKYTLAKEGRKGRGKKKNKSKKGKQEGSNKKGTNKYREM